MIQEFARRLCQTTTGTQCSAPRLSSWSLVEPAQATVSAGVADISTGGAGAIAPTIVKVHGSHFVTGLFYDSPNGGFCAQAHGYGAGTGAGAGWGLPFVGGRLVGKVPDGIKQQVIKSIGSATQGKAVEWLRSRAWSGASGGTRLVAGPDAGAELTISDFHNSFATVVGLGANFVASGVSAGIVIVAKRPVIRARDIIHARAIGLMAGVGLATALDIDVSGILYRITVI